MINTVPDILARIVDHKQSELNQNRALLADVETRAEASTAERRDFRAALRSDGPSILAEIKKASPSKGLLSRNFDPVRNATAYESGGASALSVLTDVQFFQGSLDHLAAARAAVSLPVLRKDFTIDPYHVVEAAAAGADAVLLIAAILTDRQLRDLRELAALYRMAALVEVHDEQELSRALATGADIVGVNNRNLHTFEVDLGTSHRLLPLMPASVVRVSESGIENRKQVEELHAAGYDAFLVGEHLMRSPDPAAAIRDLLPEPRT